MSGADPVVWAVLSGRAGDDAQIIALARATGWHIEEKRLAYRRMGRLLDVWRGTTLAGIRRGQSSTLAPPWPDLVISASMRNEPVCRWIRHQSDGRTRYVHIGKPWSNLSRFDLIVTAPEYRWIPDRPNVLRNDCSLHSMTPERLAEAARAWAPAVTHLPKPYIAVLVGGYAGPYPFDRETAERLAREASAMSRARGGSLLVTTSGRTSKRATQALFRSIDAPCYLHEWSADDAANPYMGLIGLADELIVTPDSTSMLAEACATRRPVHVFDLETMHEPASMEATLRRCNPQRWKAFLYRHVLLRFAPNRIKRDIGRVAKTLIANGRAVKLGEPFDPRDLPPLDELPRTLERVRRLLDQPPTPRSARHPSIEKGIENPV